MPTLIANFDLWDPHWWKEKTDFLQVVSDLFMIPECGHAHTHTHTDVYTHTLNVMILKVDRV